MEGLQRENGRNTEGIRYRIALILSFALPVIIMLAIFIANGIYPFGNRSFLYSDMYHQYMPFFSEFLNKIRAGEGLAYSYHVGIGSNFLALYVYYLASPLHWLALLVPEAFLMEFMSYLVVLKIGFCGLTFFLYLKNRFACKDSNMLFFACFYALSGFMAAYNWNIMWIDCVILLPLILLGLERLVKEGKCGLYCITLALSILTNYYISIMICIFLVLYFVGLLVTEKRSFRILCNFAFFSLLAGGLSAVLLIPEACAILETEFGSPDFPDKLESYFSVLDMLARHSLCVSTERGLAHWPNIYCGVAVFLLLPMYVMNQSISIRRKFVNLGLAGILLLGFSTNMLDFIWHGMNYPDSLPARQSFIYIFLILVMCFEAYQKAKEADRNQILYGYVAAVIFLLFCEKFVEHEDFFVGIEMLTLLFVTVYAVLLYLYRTRESRVVRNVLGLILLATVVTELTANTINTSVSTVSRPAYLDQLEDYEVLYQRTGELESAAENGSTFYRVEKFTRKTKNDGTLVGYPTASVFSSTMNSRVMDMYTQLGMRHSKVYYGFDGATAFTSALLNVEYMFGEHARYETPLYELLEQSGEVYLYESKAVLPFGYVAPTGYDLPEGYLNNGLKLQNAMVAELGIKGQLFSKVRSEASGHNVVFTAGSSGIYYGLITESGTKKIEEIGGALETHQFADLKKGGILYLGYLHEGETITLTNGDDSDETPKISADIYKMDETVLEEALAVLAANHLEDVAYDSRHMKGRITMEAPGRMILSIPYEDGWHITINGEEVQPELFGGALIAFDLEKGEHTISMNYTPEGQYAGIAVSLLSLAVLAIVNFVGKRKQRISSRSDSHISSEIPQQPS